MRGVSVRRECQSPRGCARENPNVFTWCGAIGDKGSVSGSQKGKTNTSAWLPACLYRSVDGARVKLAGVDVFPNSVGGPIAEGAGRLGRVPRARKSTPMPDHSG